MPWIKSSSNFNYLGLCGPCGDYLVAGSGVLFAQRLMGLLNLAGLLGHLFLLVQNLVLTALLLSPKSGVFGYGGWYFL